MGTHKLVDYRMMEGIHSPSWNKDGWPPRAAEILERRDPNVEAKRISYALGLSTAITSWATLGWNAERYQAALESCRPGAKRVGMVHSHGGRIAAKSHEELSAEVDDLHMIGVACFASFLPRELEGNGLNKALRSGLVERVIWHYNPFDPVLRKYAGASKRWLSWAGQGWGQGGMQPPTNVGPELLEAGRVLVIEWPREVKHSGYFEGAYFERLLHLVTDDEALRKAAAKGKAF